MSVLTTHDPGIPKIVGLTSIKAVYERCRVSKMLKSHGENRCKIFTVSSSLLIEK